ncbi:MAG: prolyl oligopeptidase family serine peptidase [Polyangiales bacterium]
MRLWLSAALWMTGTVASGGCSGDDAPAAPGCSGLACAAGSGGTVSGGVGGGGVPGVTAGASAAGARAAGASAAGTPAANGGSPAAGTTAPPPAAGSSGIPGVAGNPAAGSGGSPAAGSGGDAGLKPVVPSSGCGMATPPAGGDKTLDVDGTTREYIVRVPADYDPQKPYRLIFAWHGLGGTAAQIANGFGGGYYGLASRSMNSAILIAGQGLPTMSANGEAGGAGWPNTGGRDVAFVRKLVEWASTSYCIDMSRIFSVGMSYGGIMSNTLGCQMGDVFRAIAPMSGSGPLRFGGGTCVGQVAAWLSHGTMDTVVQFSAGEGSRDHWVMTNHCTAETAPVTPDGCVAYQGCDGGFPVHWCQFEGGHTVPPFAGDAIWQFFSQF